MAQDAAIRQLIRHRAKRFLLDSRTEAVRFSYDGNKLYAIYESDGQQEAYEVNIELLNDNTILVEPEEPAAYVMGQKVSIVGGDFDGLEGRIQAVDPQHTSYDYHVQMGMNSHIYGFFKGQLRLRR